MDGVSEDKEELRMGRKILHHNFLKPVCNCGQIYNLKLQLEVAKPVFVLQLCSSQLWNLSSRYSISYGQSLTFHFGNHNMIDI